MSIKYPFPRVLLLFFIIMFCISSSTLSLKSLEEIGHFGGVLRIKAFTNVFKQSFDPAGDSHPFLIEQVYDGLVRLDNNLKILPCLAEYWTISEDGKKYTFYLRKGVRFHHGQELVAEDVKFSLERLVHRQSGALKSQYFTPIVVGAQEYAEGKAAEVTGIRVLDKYVFEIQWKAPYVSSLYLLSMDFCKILPRELVRSQGKNFFNKPSGTGAFKFAHWLRTPKLEIVGVRLARNEDYFGKKAYLDNLEFSPHFTLDHFLDKEIDIIPFISERVAKSNCQIFEGGPFSLTFLGMSCHLPPFNRPALRKALSLALHKEKLAQASYTTELVPQVIQYFIPEKFTGVFHDKEKEVYDPQKAQKVFEEEGFLTSQKPLSVILFLMSPRNESQHKFSKELETQLGLVGIKLKIKYFNSWNEIESSTEPYLVRINWMLDFPDPENIIKPLFFSRSALNKLHYENQLLDKLLEESEIERSWSRRNELFQEMEKILAQDSPALPLFSFNQRLAVQPYVRGVKTPALGFYYLDAKEIWLENRE